MISYEAGLLRSYFEQFDQLWPDLMVRLTPATLDASPFRPLPPPKAGLTLLQSKFHPHYQDL
jgi:hypothetical protein